MNLEYFCTHICPRRHGFRHIGTATSTHRNQATITESISYDGVESKTQMSRIMSK